MYDILNEPLIAFWDYDLFPYTLYGTVIQSYSDGKVRIKEYGGGVFKPKSVMTQSRAREFIVKLQDLTRQTGIEEQKTRRNGRVELRRLSAEYSMPMPNHIESIDIEDEAVAPPIDWENTNDVWAVLRKARELWQEEQWSCSWNEANRDHYIVRAVLELLEERRNMAERVLAEFNLEQKNG